jgi:Xaa-Pro dipeptidase
MLSPAGCRQRQARLVEKLNENKLDAALITHRLEIYYFTGNLLPDLPAPYPACLYIGADGASWLAAHLDDGEAEVDQRFSYPWQIGYTLSPDMGEQLAKVTASLFAQEKGSRRWGYQAEFLPQRLAAAAGNVEWHAIDTLVFELQMQKDADEVALLRQAIQTDLAAYDAARATIAPGVNELEVLAAAQRAAHLHAGEKVFHDGDYACGEMGGFARDRPIEAGELYVIDAWTIRQGYWADLCRTFSVGGQPSDLQQSIFDHIKAFHQQVPKFLWPGRNGSECFVAMDEHIRQHPALADVGLVHHAGHNVGLRAHQMPDLNRDRGGTLAVGNVVSVEPGAYIPEACLGVRLENMYLITEEGCENLSEYPMELVP